METNYFEERTIGNITIDNCVFRSATEEGLADKNGLPTEALIKKYEALAKGGVGCIITGYIGVSKQAESTITDMCLIDSDKKIKAYRWWIESTY